jgi:bifunctional UDP-N-acetylglucosamine pyrophosphorylase/glucosamine-1-phosphate N-acetyltransferase
MKNVETLILAGGKGTRLAGGAPSPKPKVLYEIAGRPLVHFTLENLAKAGILNPIIVVSYQADQVKEMLGKNRRYAFQRRPLGTGHAVRIGLREANPKAETLLVLNGDDSVFYKPETIKAVLEKHETERNTITFVSLKVADPTGLGRVLRRNGNIVGIVEEKVASEQQKLIAEINDGLYIFETGWLRENVNKLKKSAVGEYYINRLFDLAFEQDKKVSAFELPDNSQWHSINTPQELEEADRIMREKLRHAGEN